jgi:hypothetical protein
VIIWILIAAAVAALFWPSPKPKAPATFAPITAPTQAHKPSASYLDCVSALHTVRHRLSTHGTLGDDELNAVETLMLALLREDGE